jgi:isopentenyldiphosphate isomerase
MKIPEFMPKPGQIDFTDAKEAPVINCLVKFGEKILIVKRNSKMHFYPGVWNGISGFLDDDGGIQSKVKEELSEELGLDDRHIVSLQIGSTLKQYDPKYVKTWVVHPVLVEVDTDKIKLDWEAEKYEWIKPKEIFRFEYLSGFDKVVRTFFPELPDRL